MAPPVTLDDIAKAHEGVTPDRVADYLRSLNRLGVVSVVTDVSDGHSDQHAADGAVLASAAVHERDPVAAQADQEAARAAVDAHGRGETDYFAMSRALAAAGVAEWVMDTAAGTITYRSSAGVTLFSDRV